MKNIILIISLKILFIYNKKNCKFKKNIENKG